MMMSSKYTRQVRHWSPDRIVESGCVTFVFSIRVICKYLWKLLHDIYTSILTE
jgi:hypothetical protein